MGCNTAQSHKYNHLYDWNVDNSGRIILQLDYKDYLPHPIIGRAFLGVYDGSDKDGFSLVTRSNLIQSSLINGPS